MFDWVDDLGSGLKKVGSGVTKAADVATDVIIDKDAWSNTAQAILDGAGGKEIQGSDLVNMLLDSTMLVPGVGVAGGLARVGARTAGKMAAKEAAESIAKKEVKDSLRSPLNKAIRGQVDDTATLLRGKVTEGAGKLTGKGASSRAAAKTTKGPLDSQLGRLAAKQEKGVGRKVGFGQTKKRIAANTALAGGANLATRAYDEGLFHSILGGDEEASEGGSGTASGKTVGPDAPQPGTMYIVGADGSSQAVPAGFAEALAEFMKQNGTVAGQQVVHAE